MKHIYILLGIFLSAWTLTSCLGSGNTTTEVSSDATVASLRFTANDSMPGLAAATFIIEDRIDTGLIHNIDSIQFGTRIDKVIPIFNFNATPGAAIVYTPTDTTILSVSDTINFAQRPVYLQVVASDNMHEKWYKIEVNVHKVDPDLFDWKRMGWNIYPTEGVEQKAVELQGEYYIFLNNGIQNSLYYSRSTRGWSEVSITGLPANCQVRNILQVGDTLYYADGDMLYTSTNATEWNATTLDVKLVNLLFQFNDSIWGIAHNQETNSYHLATSFNASNWQVGKQLPADFPISDYAALTFRSASNRLRAMVVGGFSSQGASLNTRWNVEYTPEKGYTWTNFSIEQPSFSSLTGASVVWYANKFYMFGGVDANNQIGEYPILESIDEGMHWNVPDSTHNCLPADYEKRTKSSVFVGSDNAIYIIGGQSRTEIFSDVYRGKLNSIDW